MDAGGTEKATEVPGLCDVSPKRAREKKIDNARHSPQRLG